MRNDRLPNERMRDVKICSCQQQLHLQYSCFTVWLVFWSHLGTILQLNKSQDKKWVMYLFHKNSQRGLVGEKEDSLTLMCWQLKSSTHKWPDRKEKWSHEWYIDLYGLKEILQCSCLVWVFQIPIHKSHAAILW